MPSSPPSSIAQAHKLVAAVSEAASAAANETQLRHEIEKALEAACGELHIAWTPFQLDRTLGTRGTRRFVDVAHGAVVIEYEPPRSFRHREGVKLHHARAQAEEYATLLADEEGRPLTEYLLATWDGASISFGRIAAAGPQWDHLVSFDDASAERLLDALRRDGTPIVHPRLLAQIAGPESAFGAALIPRLFDAIRAAHASTSTSKTKLLFSEWRRLFGQAVGVQSEGSRRLLAEQGVAHGRAYEADAPSYLFALHTYIALLAKLVAACALPNSSQDILDRRVPIGARISALESGSLFEHAGIANMASGDFFSWYHDDPAWPALSAPVDRLLTALGGVNFDVSRKSAASTRDLFKGIYESFVPRALRHALGEFYTPDWLAEHALNVVGWQPTDSLLDPTCGSGTFVLEALRRRLSNGAERTPATLLDGLHGFDLNPLAVLSAKGSLAVYIAPYLDPAKPVRLPIYLADAINPARLEYGSFVHVLQTEIGPRSFRLAPQLVSRPDFFQVFARIRELVDADIAAHDVVAAIERESSDLQIDESERSAFRSTVEVLCELHRKGWNGIWCPIVADRFAAGAVGPVAFICGNPPWVKWSHLPPEYAAFIGPRCRELGVFSSDRWVGGIESDISTVITFEVIGRYLADGGKLAFFITGTVFANESSEGFRQFRLLDGQVTCRVLAVDDFDALRPFDGVSNRPALLTVQRGGTTTFPVPYRVWTAPNANGRQQRSFKNAATFVDCARCETLSARPVPGGNGARPWLVGTDDEHAVFAKVFSSGAGKYVARKGVTTDRNGIFWVRTAGLVEDGKIRVQNDPDVGRMQGIALRRGLVEAEHVFPLLRGRGVTPFCATPDPELKIIVPQRGMHGDPALAVQAPNTFRFLRAFRGELEQRSSYRRFQARAGHPFYSLWSTGAYTFSAYKVLWREMGGGSFAAAYVGRIDDPVLGRKLVIPDHKLYFIAVTAEDEAAYLTGLLNAPLVSGAVAAYASQLSLGASVAEYLHLPRYDKANAMHRTLARLAASITRRGDGPRPEEHHRLDELAHELFDSI